MLQYFHFVGTYVFSVYAAPADFEGDDREPVFSYVISVLQARPGPLPFPVTVGWLYGYAIPEDMIKGVLEESQDLLFDLKAPGAKGAFVETAGGKQTELKEVIME